MFPDIDPLHLVATGDVVNALLLVQCISTQCIRLIAIVGIYQVHVLLCVLAWSHCKKVVQVKKQLIRKHLYHSDYYNIVQYSHERGPMDGVQIEGLADIQDISNQHHVLITKCSKQCIQSMTSWAKCYYTSVNHCAAI